MSLNTSKKLILFAALMLVGISTASAAVFTNGNLNNTCAPAGVTYCGVTGGNVLTGWTISSGSVDLITTYWNPAFGTYATGYGSVDLNGTSQGAFQQAFDLLAGHNYTVQYYYSGNPDLKSGTETANVSMTVGGSSVYSKALSYTVGSSNSTAATMVWTPQAFSFTAGSTSAVLSFASTVAGTYGVAISNVTVTDNGVPTNGVPEPATLGVMGAGLLLVCVRRFRKV